MITHRRTEFELTIPAPYRVVAPLFGADRERAWAKQWSPRFLHPSPAADVGGAIFAVDGEHPAVWINTRYDLGEGRIQYAAFVPETMVTLIDIRLEALGGGVTRACVAYERTALRPGASAFVDRLADGDEAKGADWRDAICEYVASHEGSR